MKFSVTNSNAGLGDVLSIFSLFDKERDFSGFSGSPHFNKLAKYNPYIKGISARPIHRVEQIQGRDKTVGRHFFNKIRVALGIEELEKPRPFLFVEKEERESSKPLVCMSFDVGAHAHVQRQQIHPRARIFMRSIGEPYRSLF